MLKYQQSQQQPSADAKPQGLKSVVAPLKSSQKNKTAPLNASMFAAEERANPYANDPEKLPSFINRSSNIKQTSIIKAHSMAVSA